MGLLSKLALSAAVSKPNLRSVLAGAPPELKRVVRRVAGSRNAYAAEGGKNTFTGAHDVRVLFNSDSAAEQALRSLNAKAGPLGGGSWVRFPDGSGIQVFRHMKSLHLAYHSK